MASIKRLVIVILSSIAGTAAGYPVFLFLSLALLAFYGDDGQRGHPTELLKSFLFYGVFGTTTLIGFGLGLFLSRKRRRRPDSLARQPLRR